MGRCGRTSSRSRKRIRADIFVHAGIVMAWYGGWSLTQAVEPRWCGAIALAYGREHSMFMRVPHWVSREVCLYITLIPSVR
jgi:hypothetical protein